MAPSPFLHLIVPGYGNSGPGHWQSLWEAEDPSFRRVELGDWEAPALGSWASRLEAAIAASPGSGKSLTLVVHSLSCLLTAHWAASATPAAIARIRAAFLVAPVDPAGPAFPATATGFAPVPRAALPFPSLVVASFDDPYASFDYQKALASDWGAGFAAVGSLGHINAASGIEEWPEGRRLLRQLAAG